ncbi:MAG: hypothetical protein IIB95_02980 [Candidatus Marinimicrobia bacterium]|nr:hypothetical protein [Candidatus Neomarinimicrobiota bacterium]
MAKSYVKKIFALGLLIFAVTHTSAQVELGGYFKNYNAVHLNKNYDYLILRNRLRLNFNYLPSEYALGYASFDVKNDHIGDHKDLELTLREMYIDLYFEHYDLRIGKQQIVWGEADGLFITDIVNPLDLREFILADFEDIRMGINSIKAQFYFGNSRLESIWIPQFVPAKFSAPGETWAFYTPIDEIAKSIPDSLITVVNIAEPKKRLKNSEYGFRYSTHFWGIDLALSYFHTWDDYPVFRQYYKQTSNPFIPFSVTIKPEYDRLTVLGGTFASTIGPLVIRGEGALYQKRNFYTENPGDADRVVQKDFLNVMVGAEISPGDAFISGQFIQEKIPDYDDQMVNDEIVNTGTLLLSKPFLNETFKPEIFAIFNFTHEDYWVRFSVKYYPIDGVEIILAADILGGEKENKLFSQFDENDNVYLKIKYSF